MESFLLIESGECVEDGFVVLDKQSLSESPESTEGFLYSRPVWLHDAQATECGNCQTTFTFLIRKHHCRYCGNIFCNDCSFVRASYPSWFGYKNPERVCLQCIPKLFKSRRDDPILQLKEVEDDPTVSPVTDAKAANFGSFRPVVTEDGSFLTCQSGLSLPLRFMHPLCKLAFWWSGMYEGGNFNRTYLDYAMMNLPFSPFPVASIVRHSVPVPRKWTLSENVFQSPIIKEDEPMSEIPIIVFTPQNSSSEPLPILVWFHGGGFCLGSADNFVYHCICSALANLVGCIVASVDYRLAPEFKYPTQAEDAYAALKWCREHAQELNGDISRIAVGGDSAGGSLAAVVSILSRERKFESDLCHQLLVYPCLTSPLTDDIPSQVTYKDGPVLSRSVCEWFMLQLFDDVEAGLKNPLAMPLLVESLENLPPATIINALHDPLCDHGSLFAEKLRKDGIPVTRTVYSNSLHGFFGSSVGESNEAVAEAAAALKMAFWRG